MCIGAGKHDAFRAKVISRMVTHVRDECRRREISYPAEITEDAVRFVEFAESLGLIIFGDPSTDTASTIAPETALNLRQWALELVMKNTPGLMTPEQAIAAGKKIEDYVNGVEGTVLLSEPPPLPFADDALFSIIDVSHGADHTLHATTHHLGAIRAALRNAGLTIVPIASRSATRL